MRPNACLRFRAIFYLRSCGLLTCLLLSLPMMAPGWAFAQQIENAEMGKRVNIQGRVSTDQGVTVTSGCTVRIQSEDGDAVAVQPVNSAGEFYFQWVSKGQYTLIVTADGFEPYEQQLDLGEDANTVNLNIALTARRAVEDNVQPPALSDAQAPKSAKREYEKAVKAIKARKLGDARRQLEAAVAAYPCYARAQTDLGLVFSQQKNFKDSETAFRKSISCDPGYLDAYSALGDLLNAEQRYAEAAAVLEQGLRQAPGSWKFSYQMGIAHYGMKNYEAAEQDYHKAQFLNASPPLELHAKLADVYLRENAFQKAYAEMQSYLKAAPEGPFAPKI